VRVLAAYAEHSDCALASVGFAVGADFDRLLLGTKYQASFGQSPFAFARGKAFEKALARNGYDPVFRLLREGLAFDLTDTRVANLRRGFPPNREGLKLRAGETRRLLSAIATGDAAAPNLIDGAVLEANVGGVRAFFEADSLAARSQGRIFTGEVKSFPVVDGRADPDKVGAALDQAAIYTQLTRNTVEAMGGSGEVVSSEALLITPRNVGLTPILSVKDIGRRIDRAERLLARAPNLSDLESRIPEKLNLGAVARVGDEPVRRLDVLDAIADSIGTRYRPSCLTHCGLSRFCRARAFAAGAPALGGSQLERSLSGVASLDRAADLATGAPPGPDEEPVARQLSRAARLYAAQQVRPVGKGQR
jgi:hypothetical protein